MAHVALRLDGQNVPPSKVIAEGQVCNEAHILDDDCKFAFLGDQDALKPWQNRALAEEVSSITVFFQESSQ